VVNCGTGHRFLWPVCEARNSLRPSVTDFISLSAEFCGVGLRTAAIRQCSVHEIERPFAARRNLGGSILDKRFASLRGRPKAYSTSVAATKRVRLVPPKRHDEKAVAPRYWPLQYRFTTASAGAACPSSTAAFSPRKFLSKNARTNISINS